MRALPASNHSQKGPRSHDAHPGIRILIPAVTLSVGGRVICIHRLLPVEQVIRPAHSVRFDGWRRRSAHFLPAQQASQFIADRSIHRRRLSSSTSLVGPYANENGLTYAQTFFASGANADD